MNSDSTKVSGVTIPEWMLHLTKGKIGVSIQPKDPAFVTYDEQV